MTNLPARLLHLLALLCVPLGIAARAHAGDDFLEPERAFPLSARVLDERQVELSFNVAPGYYLYREQFKFAAGDATLGAVAVPPGKTKFDETFQKTVETHRGLVRISVPVSQATANFRLMVTSQGCADQGLCYPPQQREVAVSLAAYGGDGSARVLPVNDSLAVAAPAGQSAGQSAGEGAGIDAALRSGRFWTVVGVFFAAGVLLSLTPCVLPMLPILSSLIAGQGGAVSRSRGLALAGSYSLGMALVYTAFGIAAGLAGEGLAAALQTPWVLGAFALGLLALAASMFGAYELQLPGGFSGRVNQAAQQLPAPATGEIRSG